MPMITMIINLINTFIVMIVIRYRNPVWRSCAVWLCFDCPKIPKTIFIIIILLLFGN